MKVIDLKTCVHAARHYYSEGAPPALCAKLIDRVIELGFVETRGVAESRQCWNRMMESYPEMTPGTLRAILRDIGRD